MQSMNAKVRRRARSIPALCALYLALTGLAPVATLHAQPGKTLDKVVAVVGNEIITLSELDFQILRTSLRAKIDANDPVVRRKVLDELMNRKLILAQAILDSVDVSEEQVDGRLNDQIKYYQQSYGSVEKLEQSVGMTVAQMKREFRDEIRKNMMIEAIQNDKFGSIAVTSREVTDFFQSFKDSIPRVPEQVHLRQITIFPQVVESFKTAARRKAEAILDSLRHGADFMALAKQHSDDPGSAANGGDLGLARRGVFVREFEEAAFALQPDQLSPVVETPFGYHIIKLIERKGESVRARHILIRVQKTGESDSASIRTLADIKKRILAGEDFDAVARQYSQDESTRNLGGDLGTVEVAQLSDDLHQVEQNLSEGGISEPSRLVFDKDYGFSLVQLVKRIPPHAPSLQGDYQRIAGFAKVFKQNKLYLDWIESIKTNVYWKVSL
jgi:peptidyl-prolyl cis-trans isomerase SurA